MNDIIKLALAYIAIPAIIFAAVLNVVAFSILWGWFIVPLGAPSISIAHAFGIGLTFNLLMYSKATTRDVEKIKEDKATLISVWKQVWMSLMAPTFAICIGWLVLQIWGI